MSYRLPKSHRLCSRTAVEHLFDRESGSRVAVSFPLRAVWRHNPDRPVAGAPAQFMITVPKKRLRHAVDRVTMRRRIRESYRLCHSDFPVAEPTDIAFIYLADTLLPYDRIQAAIRSLLARIHPCQ